MLNRLNGCDLSTFARSLVIFLEGSGASESCDFEELERFGFEDLDTVFDVFSLFLGSDDFGVVFGVLLEVVVRVGFG